ncbi:putative C2 domain, synaptotagmin-like mitochondrial-lipid-binding domain, C2 domain superfamily [Helianthus annuus]|nr:putative C2 domain, synaptotagmin-like mitochondrial-lipid-binding domain, C2 domain superfamily [Helianthus annuus]KAJ0601114.1 putative C2 domain, synaptotagmin-like mitochondrial-lipid-binding domain, C2 domain superfamily [Helianthus annuus]KAJ0608283.1 putative C2 domain, synaptotagmin-like mitochondrial-lipid-binding domain, C2 domain superfamily [Helianthus annuus]KAJ0768349.1 putative C2 domain, synaptotagmin-like mitochondrial-lipid-binding domain, C2 domain superfamily [Helianthus a
MKWMDVKHDSVIYHVGIVLFLIWLLSSFDCCHPLVYFLSFIYLYMVHDRCGMRLRRRVQFEERKQANQKRVLSDSESVRWLNHAIERIWPICMEDILSQKILTPIIPWFLQKYKPWTVKEAVLQNLYLGRSPPMFTEMRVCRQSTGDDHLVLELGMNFRAADDMNAILAVKLTKRLGFGMWTKMHLTGMHIEGKVLVGVKFLSTWPFLGRLRVCFLEPPYFQVTVKPIFAHGFDVTELPGIAGWLDKLLTLAFEETLVEPNMLVVDVEKLVSPQPEFWFSVDAKEPLAYALVEIVAASDMKPSDMNGLADPYVKGQLGAYRFRTKTQRKTLSPKWQEEFKIPITTWESPNLLIIQVRNKDHFIDDILGDCSIKINDLRDGQRHDMWLPLQNIKTGRLHITIQVIEVDTKVTEQPCDADASASELNEDSPASDPSQKEIRPGPVADDFEPIDVEGQRATGIWVHHPGTGVPQVWEPRKGKTRVQKGSESVGSSTKSGSFPDDLSFSDDSLEGSNKTSARNRVKRGLSKIGLVLNRTLKTDNDRLKGFKKTDTDNNWESQSPSPCQNVRAVNENGVTVNLVMEENMLSPGQDPKLDESGPESANNGKVKDVAKRILKRAGNSARSMKHVFSGKGSRMRRDADMAVESDSSFDGSIPSPVYGEVSPRVTEETVDEDEDDMEEFVNSLQGDNETPIDNNHESPLVQS